MGNQINTQPQTFKTNTVVMGSTAGLSAVSGLTVYGDISASGTIYGSGAVPVKTSYTFNGLVSTFAVSGFTNTTPENYLVHLDGVYQAPGTAYTLSGDNIVMSQIPGSGVVADVIAYQSQRAASSVSIVAWVNFTGNGAVGNQVINASYNVASVAKTATGAYTITFTNNIQDENYNVHANVLATAGSTANAQVSAGTTPTVSQVRIQTSNASGTLADAEKCYVSIIR